DFRQTGRGCTQHPGERAEAGKQVLGERFGVALWQDHVEQEFEQFIVGKRIAADGIESVPGALTMSYIVRLYRSFSHAIVFVAGDFAQICFRASSGLNRPPGEAVKIS